MNWLFGLALFIFCIALFLLSDAITNRRVNKTTKEHLESIMEARERFFEIASGYEDIAKVPCRATGSSAGYDLHAALTEPWVIGPGQTRLIPTGVAAFMMPDEELQIRPRSGMALKHGVTVLNSPGTIDADYYPDAIGVLLHNAGNYIFRVEPGDRIAQAVFSTYLAVSGDEHGAGPQKRSGGFGSSGK